MQMKKKMREKLKILKRMFNIQKKTFSKAERKKRQRLNKRYRKIGKMIHTLIEKERVGRRKIENVKALVKTVEKKGMKMKANAVQKIKHIFERRNQRFYRNIKSAIRAQRKNTKQQEKKLVKKLRIIKANQKRVKKQMKKTMGEKFKILKGIHNIQRKAIIKAERKKIKRFIKQLKKLGKKIQSVRMKEMLGRKRLKNTTALVKSIKKKSLKMKLSAVQKTKQMLLKRYQNLSRKIKSQMKTLNKTRKQMQWKTKSGDKLKNKNKQSRHGKEVKRRQDYWKWWKKIIGKYRGRKKLQKIPESYMAKQKHFQRVNLHLLSFQNFRSASKILKNKRQPIVTMHFLKTSNTPVKSKWNPKFLYNLNQAKSERQNTRRKLRPIISIGRTGTFKQKPKHVMNYFKRRWRTRMKPKAGFLKSSKERLKKKGMMKIVSSKIGGKGLHRIDRLKAKWGIHGKQKWHLKHDKQRWQMKTGLRKSRLPAMWRLHGKQKWHLKAKHKLLLKRHRQRLKNAIIYRFVDLRKSKSKKSKTKKSIINSRGRKKV